MFHKLSKKNLIRHFATKYSFCFCLFSKLPYVYHLNWLRRPRIMTTRNRAESSTCTQWHTNIPSPIILKFNTENLKHVSTHQWKFLATLKVWKCIGLSSVHEPLKNTHIFNTYILSSGSSNTPRRNCRICFSTVLQNHLKLFKDQIKSFKGARVSIFKFSYLTWSFVQWETRQPLILTFS